VGRRVLVRVPHRDRVLRTTRRRFVVIGQRRSPTKRVVYCSADKEFVEVVLHAYEAKTGVKSLSRRAVPVKSMECNPCFPVSRTPC
jgi:hypothetical protein